MVELMTGGDQSYLLGLGVNTSHNKLRGNTQSKPIVIYSFTLSEKRETRRM
jgi:hypothetical protein